MKTSSLEQRTASPDLTEEELFEITKLKQNAARARYFRRIGVSFERRNDGTISVNRARYDYDRGVRPANDATASVEPKWGVHG